MIYLTFGACIVAILLLLLVLKSLSAMGRSADMAEKSAQARADQLDKLVDARVGRISDAVEKGFTDASSRQADLAAASDRLVQEQLSGVSRSVDGMGRLVKEQLDAVRKTVDEELSEHLDKKLSESFSQVTSQLESVYKGLGEMQTLAQGVGDLKRVLSNTKARGILGEAQLGAIIGDILAPGQYEENVATVPGSTERVEFAVKLPVEGGAHVWLPIDAKFPGDTYAALQDAYESGDRAQVDQAAKALCSRLRSEAKDIRDKYVRAPDTAEFGVMFLPFEGLYAEAARRGMAEELSRDYRVNIAGPSTIAALLCSLQMSFRSIAIQRRSQEVWDVLSAVQTEFGKFGDALDKVETRLNQAVGEVGTLKTTRMNAMRRRLKGVQAMPDGEAAAVLGIGQEGGAT